jgi:predicted nucleic acid-binding protein
MRICIDTNVLLQLFGAQSPYGRIIDGLQQGSLELAVSNEIWLEYEETVTHLSGKTRWQAIDTFF